MNTNLINNKAALIVSLFICSSLCLSGCSGEMLAAGLNGFSDGMQKQDSSAEESTSYSRGGTLASEMTRGSIKYCKYTDGAIQTIDSFKFCPFSSDGK